jgi:hypothetical protein
MDFHQHKRKVRAQHQLYH